MEKVNEQAQHRPLSPADHKELHRQSAAVLRLFANSYAKMAAKQTGQGIEPRDQDTVNLKVPWLLLRKAFEQWERLIDEAGVK
jgi:hypothetical protein